MIPLTKFDLKKKKLLIFIWEQIFVKSFVGLVCVYKNSD